MRAASAPRFDCTARVTRGTQHPQRVPAVRMPVVTIRPVKAEEVEHCIRLGVDAFESIPASDLVREQLLGGVTPNGKDWRYRRGDAFRAEFARAPEEGCNLVAEVDEQVVGFVQAESNHTTGEGLIHYLAVEASYQGLGLGRQLLDAGTKWLREQGMVVAKIDTLESNDAGLYLYPEFGFTEVNREVHLAMRLDADAPTPGTTAGGSTEARQHSAAAERRKETGEELVASWDRQITATQLLVLLDQTGWASGRSRAGVSRMLSATQLKLGLWRIADDKLVGFLRVLTDGVYRALIDDVVVDESLRGTGWGTTLLEVACARLAEVEEVKLGCAEATTPFYERLGFRGWESPGTMTLDRPADFRNNNPHFSLHRL
eukprot:COSAG02_NODE_10739_length_1869_cov_1.716949_1_plen_373_part_00